MRLFLTFCIVLSAVFVGEASRTHKKKNFHLEKKEKEKPKITETEKKHINKLSIQAKRMLMEGEGFRSYSNISGKIAYYKATCPVCENVFKAITVDRQLPEKGMDADYCKHSKNLSAYDFKIWTCCSCGYSNFPHLFRQKPKAYDDAKFKKSIHIALKTLFIKNMGIDINKLGYNLDQSDIPTFMKYFLFKLNIPKGDFSNKILADFHLHYSWIHRQRFLAPIAHPNLSIPISVFNEKLRNYAKRNKVNHISSSPSLVLQFLQQVKFSPSQNIEGSLALHFKAKCMNRLGRPKLAMQLMKEAIAFTIDSNLRRILINKKRILLDEFEQSKLALKHIKLALRENAYEKETPQYVYLIGQLSKRLELNNTANLWLNASVKLLKNYSDPSYELAKTELRQLPPFIDQDQFEMDKILIQTIISDYTKEYIKGDKNTPKFSLDEVHLWLVAMERACLKYYTELDFDPKNLKELVDVGLLTKHPKLTGETIKYFKVEIDDKSTMAKKRFKLSSVIPFEDKDGLFWPSINNGKISRVRY
jgi:hypothetical protein